LNFNLLKSEVEVKVVRDKDFGFTYCENIFLCQF